MVLIGIAEVKRNISALVNRVAFGGERIILTSRGHPKAALISIEDLRKLERLENEACTLYAERKAALAMAKAVREMTLARRGVPFPDVTEDMRQLREERDFGLASVR